MANDQKSGAGAGGDGSFLGGAAKFNQAGNNAPMAGEKVAEANERAPFGGPRVWLGTIVILVALVLLYAVYGDHIPGVSQRAATAAQFPQRIVRMPIPMLLHRPLNSHLNVLA